MKEYQVDLYEATCHTLSRQELKEAARDILKKNGKENPHSRFQHLAAMFIIGVPYSACEKTARIDLSGDWFSNDRFKEKERFALTITKYFVADIIIPCLLKRACDNNAADGRRISPITYSKAVSSSFLKVVEWLNGSEFADYSEPEAFNAYFSALVDSRLAREERREWEQYLIYCIP